MTTSRVLVLLVLSVSGCSAFDSEETLVGALRWYHRWIAELPVTAQSIDCSVAAFPTARFAYCEPGSLGVDIDTPQGSRAVAINITRVLSDFPVALTDFVNHRRSGPEHKPTIRKFSVLASSLSA